MTKIPEEYVDTLCTWIEEWANDESSWILPQFWAERKIGWPQFKVLVEHCPRLKVSFDVALAQLATRWFNWALRTPEMPRHMEKILIHYLEKYDLHIWDQVKELKCAVAKEETHAVLEFLAEDYGKENLDGVYKRIYDENTNKRRSSEKAK